MTTLTRHVLRIYLGDSDEPVKLDIECYEENNAPCRLSLRTLPDVAPECVVCDAVVDITDQDNWAVTRYQGDCDGIGPCGEITLSDEMPITVMKEPDCYYWAPKARR